MAGVPVMDARLVAGGDPAATPPDQAVGARATVRFAGGRRPEASTHVALAEFDGPLALLLSLIEARKLDILTVPLGRLADAYLDALGSLGSDRLSNVSAFVAVAGQLILIKSRAMLPRPPVAAASTPDDEVDPEAELRARLLLYRAHRDAGQRLAVIAAQRVGLFRREPATARASGVSGASSTDGPVLDPDRLVRALDRLAVLVPAMPAPPEVMPRTITLTERAELIRTALRGASPVVLQDLLAGVRDRVVIAVTFLAMLELMKRREIVVTQEGPWGPITARATTAEERALAGVEESEPDAPLDETLESFA